MIKFEVKNKFSGAVQFTAEINCAEDASVHVKLGLAVRWAYRSGADLGGAYLSGADLGDADLSGADLIGADLSGAYLIGADLGDAYLRGADLRGADLRGAYLGGADLGDAYLGGADLSGADLGGAYLIGADLGDAKGLDLPDPAVAEERIRNVAKAALASDNALAMDAWHTCETTHCIAGWAIHQAGEEGAKLEAELGAAMAGLRLLGIEAAAHFYDSNAAARKWLQSKLDAAQAAPTP